jgi:5-methylcytosine-specific restriction endonuclease McrA
LVKLKAAPSQLVTVAISRLKYADSDSSSVDKKRNALKPERRWYHLKRWKDLRLKIFERELFTCQECGVIEGDTSKLICDHIKPHKGDRILFWDEENLQTLCWSCHSGEKQSQERKQGY